MDAWLRESFLRELMILQLPQVLSADSTQTNTNGSHIVDVQLFSELTGSEKISGRTLSASFVACDTNLTHILLNDLKTPIGTQPSALVRLNDVIAIEYR